MRSAIERMPPLPAVVIAAVVVAAALGAAALTSAATSTPPATPPTPAASSTTVPSPETSIGISPTPALSPTLASSSPTTALRRTPLPTASPEPAAVRPTPVAMPEAREDDASQREPPAPLPLPTSPPVAAVRAFRTPERDAEPAFVAPEVEPPAADDAQPDAAPTEAMPPPDQPYVATVTFRAVASTEVDGFELDVIYPRSAGDFVGSRERVDCRKTGDATLFADDNDQGTLRLLVASRSQALAFPFDVVCHFTVEPNAVLTARLIAVNVAQVTSASAPADPSVLTVTIIAH